MAGPSSPVTAIQNASTAKTSRRIILRPQGSTSSSTTTVNMTLPSSGVSVIRATVTIDVLIALGRPMFINGEKVEKGGDRSHLWRRIGSHLHHEIPP
jgi:hypothetical protein